MNSKLLLAVSAAFVLSSSNALASWAEKCMNPMVTCINITNITDTSIDLNDPVPIKNPTSANKQKIIWKLPEGYVFNFNGGKVELKSTETPGDEFLLWTPLSDDNDDDDTAGLSKRYKVMVKKRLLNSNGYKYQLTFHEMNGGKPTRKFVCDPVIANSDPITRGMQQLLKTVACTVSIQP